jgi:hypothetical protein
MGLLGTVVAERLGRIDEQEERYKNFLKIFE